MPGANEKKEETKSELDNISNSGGSKGEEQAEMTDKTVRLVGTIEPYILGEVFEDYLVGITNYFALNKIEDETYKVRLLINLIGTNASTKIIKSFLPEDFSKQKYDVVVEKCRKLFGVERNSIVEHFKFNNRCQKEGESLSDFAVELQILSEHCEFKTFLDTALRDRFVAGIINKHTKKALLSLDSKKTFSDVVESAKREEMVYNEATRMKVGENVSINQVKVAGNDRRDFKQNQSANGQNGKGWSRSQVARVIQCFVCHKFGHIARNCYQRRNTNTNNRQTQGQGQAKVNDYTVKNMKCRIAIKETSDKKKLFFYLDHSENKDL
jgi:hypothetical protein